MTKLPPPTKSDTPTFFWAFLRMLQPLYEKELFSFQGHHVRLLPVLLLVWGVLFVVAAATWRQAVSAIYIFVSIAFIPMISFFWRVGFDYSRLLRIRQPFGFWQTVGLGAPLAWLFWILIPHLIKR